MAHMGLRRRDRHGEAQRQNAAVVLCVIAVVAAAPARVPGQERQPGAPAVGAADIARHVPLRNLVVYLEFDGLDAHAAAWRSSAAYKLLNDTKLGAIVEDLVLQGVERAQESIPREKRAAGPEVIGLLKHIARNGFVLGITRKGQDDWGIVAVVRRGDRPEIKRLLDIAGAAGRRPGDDQQANATLLEKALHAQRPLGATGAWQTKGGNLILTSKTNIEAIVAVAGGTEPGAEGHPLRAELAREVDGFRPAARGFVDLAALEPDLAALGIDGMKRIELRWGFQDDALLTRLRVVAPAPRRGLTALLDQPNFTINSLPPLPANLTHLSVLSIDLAKSFDMIDRHIKRLDPPSPDDPPSPGILARHGIDVRRDLLAHLGPRLAFYAQAPSDPDTATAASLLMSQVAGFTLSAQVRDQARVASGIDSLIKSFNPILREQLRGVARNQFGPSLAFLKFAKAAGPRPVYVLDLPRNTMPEPFVKALRPTVVVDSEQLVVSASRLAADQAVANGPRWQPAGEFAALSQKFPAEMIYMSLSDPRASTAVFVRTLPILVRQINAEYVISGQRAGKAAGDVLVRLDPESIPSALELNRRLFPSATTLAVDEDGANLTHRAAIPTLTSPAVAGALAAMLAPAITASRAAARRARCVNNIKQIALALHNYHAANNTFPRPATLDAKGNSLLSWRVVLLPFLGQQELYNKFKQDEPWDSPHNRALLKEMPLVYVCPDRARIEPFTTSYRVFAGNGALFDKDRDIGVRDVTDGTSNTIMFVEAEEAVPWTKPEVLPFDPAAAPSLYGAGSSHPGGFNASMADGAVRFLSTKVDLGVFRALITRAGGEVVRAGGF